jgi:HK97 family phage major capsid protein
MHKRMFHTTVKTTDAAEGRVGGYLVIWGHPRQRDLQGEYFTPDTDLGLDWFERRPVLYHHGLDGNLKAAVIGVIDTLRADSTGLWAEAQLDLRKQYVRTLQRLIDRGILAWSSGSLPHLVEVADDGRILHWPIVEGSLTPAPAEPRRTDVRTIKSAFESIGVAFTLPQDAHQQENAMYDETVNTLDSNDTTARPALKRLPVASAMDAHKAAPITVGSRYDRLNPLDLLHGYMLMRAVKSFQGVSEQYSNALAYKVQKNGLSAVKADELSHSTQTGYGDEWLPDLWSGMIWEKARQDNVVLPLFRAIEMPSNPFELPIEGTDPQVYYVPETRDEAQLSLGTGAAIPGSKVGSGKVQLAAKKLALRVGFSSELVEDSIVPVLNIYREQAVRAIADSIDYALVNGDTTTTGDTNINKGTGSPAGSERYLVFDGLRKLPLVTNTANRVSMAAAPTLAKLRETRFKMLNRYSARPSDLAWIVDGNTYAALLALPEFLTMDKAGAMATAMTGQIGFIDGIPVFVSAELPLTTALGVVDTSGNTKGTALCVYRPGWYVGYRRRIAVNVEYLTYYDSYQLTATVRLAFARFDDEVASALYNVTV